MSKTVLTQFGRALKQLGIEHIAAYSPQARGRSERVFGTLQDRLPKEFALAGITTVEAANRWLRDVYIAEHNKRFAIDAEQEGSAFVADATGAWREILCIQEERTVGNDNTVKWHGSRPRTLSRLTESSLMLREPGNRSPIAPGWQRHPWVANPEQNVVDRRDPLVVAQQQMVTGGVERRTGPCGSPPHVAAVALSGINSSFPP